MNKTGQLFEREIFFLGFSDGESSHGLTHICLFIYLRIVSGQFIAPLRICEV